MDERCNEKQLNCLRSSPAEVNFNMDRQTVFKKMRLRPDVNH